MSEPIVFISHFRVKEGKLDALRQLAQDMSGHVREQKPRTVVFLPYVDEDGRANSVIHVFPDADALDVHFEGADERSRVAYEALEPAGWEIYGRPSDDALEALRRLAAAAGVTLMVQPENVGGFLRLAPG